MKKNKDITGDKFFQIFGQQIGRTAVLTVLSIVLIIFFSAGWWIGKLTTGEYGVVMTTLAGAIVALITLTQPTASPKTEEAEEAADEHANINM